MKAKTYQREYGEVIVEECTRKEFVEPPHEAACEGCEHLWWEHDMGKSIPRCKLGMEMTTLCEGFKANSLYASYIEKFGKEQ